MRIGISIFLWIPLSRFEWTLSRDCDLQSHSTWPNANVLSKCSQCKSLLISSIRKILFSDDSDMKTGELSKQLKCFICVLNRLKLLWNNWRQDPFLNGPRPSRLTKKYGLNWTCLLENCWQSCLKKMKLIWLLKWLQLKWTRPFASNLR